MTWTGLPLNVLLWIGGGASMAILSLYLLRIRRRAVSVPFGPLWDRVLRDRKSSLWLSQLRRIFSLLVQWVLLMLLTVALGDLRCADTEARGRHLVILVDTSASMGATDVLPSRLERSKLGLLELIGTLGANDQALIAQMDAAVTPRSPMTGDLAPLRQATAALSVSHTEANWPQALRFALDSLKGKSRPEIVLVSDGALGPELVNGVLPEFPGLSDVMVSYLPVGSAADNVAITAFSVRRYPLDRSRYEVLLQVANTGEKTARLQVSLWGDEQLVYTTELTVNARQSVRKILPQLSGVDRRLEARLRIEQGHDWLALDNHAYAVLPGRRRSRVLVMGQPNAYLQAALLLDEYLEVVSVQEGEKLPPGQFDVTIFDGVARPRQTRFGSLFYLGMPENPEHAPLDVATEIEQFGFDQFDAKHPLFHWIVPGNIQVLRGHSFVPQPGDRVVGASERRPIAVSGQRGGQKFVILGFDPRNSDFVLRAGWPLFVLNVLHYFAQAEGEFVTSLQTGHRGSLPVAADGGSLQLVQPDGVRRSVVARRGRLFFTPRQAGFYTLLSPGARGDSNDLLFAVNLGSSAESQIAPIAPLHQGSATLQRPMGLQGATRHSFWAWLLLVALGISALEWLSFHCRWTV